MPAFDIIAQVVFSVTLLSFLLISLELVSAWTQKRGLRFDHLGLSATGVLGFCSPTAFVCLKYHLSYQTFLLLTAVSLLSLWSVAFLLARRGTASEEEGLPCRHRTDCSRTCTEYQNNLGNGDIKVCFFVVVVMLAVGVSVLNTVDADDAMYLSAALRMIDSSSLNQMEPSFGEPGIPAHPAWRYPAWELMVSAVAKVTGIHTLILFHLVVPFVVAILSVSAYLRLSEYLFGPDKAYRVVFAILLFNIMFMGSHWSSGCFFFTRLWQGKAVFLHLVWPVLVFGLMRYMAGGRLVDYLVAASCLLASAAVSQSAIFLSLAGSGLVVASFGVTNLSRPVIKRVLALAPVVVFSLVILSDIVFDILPYLATSQVSATREGLSWTALLNGYIGADTILPAFLLVIPLILVVDKRPNVKIFLVIFPVLLCAIILNPWAGEFIIKQLRVDGNYFRFFWLFPAPFLMGWLLNQAVTVLAGRVRSRPIKRLAFLCVAVAAFLAIFFTSGMNCRCGGIDRNEYVIGNPYRISSAVLPILDYIDALKARPGPLVLAPEAVAWIVPTYCRNARMVAARPQYIDYSLGFPWQREERDSRKRLLQALLSCPDDIRQLKADLDLLKVNVVITETTRPDIISVFRRLGFKEQIVSGTYAALSSQ